MPSHVRETLRSPGEPLDERLRTTFEPRLGHDFGRVRVHSGEQAAASARQLHARAYTFGHDLVFGPNRYDPGSQAGQTLIAHELAHVVQQSHAGRRSLQLDSELEQLPEDERKKVHVKTGDLDRMAQAIVDKLFRTAEEMPIPAERTIRFGASVAAGERNGLKSVVGALTTPPEGVAAPFLTRNTAVSLAIPAAGKIYRLTRLDRPSTAAAGARGPMPEVVVVEQAGVIPPKPLSMGEIFDASPGLFGASKPLAVPRTGPVADCLEGPSPELCHRGVVVGGGRRVGDPDPLVILKSDKVTLRKVTFERGPGWFDRDWNLIVAALEQLPDPILKEVAGVKFLRQAKDVCKPGEPDCDPNVPASTNSVKKTITIFDTAFIQSTTRFGTQTWLIHTLLHEIGHVADFNPIEDAWKDEKTIASARSRSGKGWVTHKRPGRSDLIWLTELGGVAKGSFREAAIQDGLQVDQKDDKKITSGGITTYGQTSWGELFAESFSLYLNDPDLLKAIRPNVYKFMVKTYPSGAAKATP